MANGVLRCLRLRPHAVGPYMEASASFAPYPWRSASSKPLHKDMDQMVPVSASRLDQLLEAEVTSFALREPRPLTLQSILELASSNDPAQLAQFLYEELPVRFAQRVKMIEALPEWSNRSAFVDMRKRYVTSFKELRLTDPGEPDNFSKRISAIKDRHAHTNLLVDGFKQYSATDELGEDQINEWLDRFFALRVSTNLLMSHYLQISQGLLHANHKDSLAKLQHTAGFDLDNNPYISYVDQCEPVRITEHAAHIVQRLGRLHYGIAPRILVTDCGAKAFPFVPRFILYVLSEVLKNSVRATIETHFKKHLDKHGQYLKDDRDEKEEALPPITVHVSGNENVCSIRISDEGGGIAGYRLGHIWSYLYTTAQPIEKTMTRGGVDAPEDLVVLRNAMHSTNNLIQCPIAGMGCGLPLSRLYARYLGGNLDLQTLPGFGTDVFVYFSCLGNSAESLTSLPHL